MGTRGVAWMQKTAPRFTEAWSELRMLSTMCSWPMPSETVLVCKDVVIDFATLI